MKFFTQTAKHKINKTLSADCLEKLPNVIRKTDWLRLFISAKEHRLFPKANFSKYAI